VALPRERPRRQQFVHQRSGSGGSSTSASSGGGVGSSSSSSNTLALLLSASSRAAASVRWSALLAVTRQEVVAHCCNAVAKGRAVQKELVKSVALQGHAAAMAVIAAAAAAAAGAAATAAPLRLGCGAANVCHVGSQPWRKAVVHRAEAHAGRLSIAAAATGRRHVVVVVVTVIIAAVVAFAVIAVVVVIVTAVVIVVIIIIVLTVVVFTIIHTNVVALAVVIVVVVVAVAPRTPRPLPLALLRLACTTATRHCRHRRQAAQQAFAVRARFPEDLVARQAKRCEVFAGQKHQVGAGVQGVLDALQLAHAAGTRRVIASHH
jgi:hypothetical protein